MQGIFKIYVDTDYKPTTRCIFYTQGTFLFWFDSTTKNFAI